MALRRPGYRVAHFELPGFHDYVVVELKYETAVVAEAGKFVGKEDGIPDAEKLNSLLTKFAVREVRQQFSLKRTELRRALDLSTRLPDNPSTKAVENKIAAVFDKKFDAAPFFKSDFVQIVPSKATDAERILSAFKRHPAVWTAHLAPRPVPPLYLQLPDIASQGPFNLEPTQGYLYSAPIGVGALDAWSTKGGNGKGITICDVEYAWNLKHEDLPTGINLIGGTMVAADEFINHGTAVLGEMVSVPNAFGTVGISPAAKAIVQSANDNGIYNLAAAIDNATINLGAGDVMLIEQHAELHAGSGDYVAMQYWPDVFTAIQAAVDKGIVVVEAAGNGNQDFEAAKFKDTGLQKDAGAIVVGAGVPPTNRIDFNGFGPQFPSYAELGVPRSRIFFSNYGQIVNLQGWGWHVSSTGYGDAQGGGDANKWYTFRFSGTSSASPIVAGAAACLQGAAIAKLGKPLTPDRTRKILVKTGADQQDGPGVPAASNHIGPQPNLVAAIKEL